MEYTFPGFPNIAVSPGICAGKPHVRGTRITISAILAHLAGGMRIESMLQEFPRLKQEDIFAALAFAA